MKVRSDLRAGKSLQECRDERDYWKEQSRLMQKYLDNPKKDPPRGLDLVKPGSDYVSSDSSYSGNWQVPVSQYGNILDRSGACG